MMSEKLCCTCKWWTSYENACTNGYSAYCADFTDPDNSCEQWEGNYEEGADDEQRNDI